MPKLPPAGFAALVTAIAAELPPDWGVRPPTADDPYSIEIDGPAGAGIHIGQDHTGRLVITGCWPPSYGTWYFHPREGAPTITVRADRGPLAIAGEISRRFLPAYLPLYAQQVQDRIATIAREAATESLADELARLSGGDRQHNRAAFSAFPPGMSIRGEIGGPDSVRLTLDCPAAQARAALQACLDVK
ncbi:MAG: hypothetical protein KKA73_06455 [Chloroflexi bacterium]|nr:hypothetical protein [Chloroflexota bacterium]MBU1747312.1 hypothetical protein [Chloroflexota bacterium]